ncbi:MAG: Omp28 family outer membrane lipoprotein [Bacteroidales bacterium]|nr:Omp28 family outer membrane lipoprotein [Bacteroidales bacterium]
MKKILISLTAICLTLFVVSCDKIEGPYLEVDNQEEVTAEFPDVDPSTAYRKVLIEEYTGHRCPNCPTGHEKLEELLNTYGDTLVPVCIHATTLAAPTAEFPNDFRTEVGNELTDYYQISGIPAGIINRENVPMGSIPARWTSKIQAVDRTDVPAAIQIVNQYGEIASNVLKVNVKVSLLKAYTEELRLSLFLVEDGIVSPQIDGTETIEDYVHNHMLRAALNGTYGTVLSQPTAGYAYETYLYAKTISFSGHDWNPDNCSIVAILYDKNNYDVLQVETCPVK